MRLNRDRVKVFWMLVRHKIQTQEHSPLSISPPHRCRAKSRSRTKQSISLGTPNRALPLPRDKACFLQAALLLGVCHLEVLDKASTVLIVLGDDPDWIVNVKWELPKTEKTISFQLRQKEWCPWVMEQEGGIQALTKAKMMNITWRIIPCRIWLRIIGGGSRMSCLRFLVAVLVAI